jgi:DNA-binding SARP family transcriptional activator/tetratricopeptide (TPR) repeat protein
MAVVMAFGLLGPLTVRADGVAVSIAPGKQRVLLAALLLRGGRLLAADELAGLLWGEAPPPSAPVTLQNYVKRLRRALGTGRDRIVTMPGGYLIRAEPGELDVTAMEAALAAGRRAAQAGTWPDAGAQASAALALWRDEPLCDVDSAELTTQEVPRLTELRFQARELWIEAGLELGGHAMVVAEARQLAAGDPLREHPHALLIRALYGCGRRSEALRTYQDARRVLVTELGCEPGPELQALHREILDDNPTLSLVLSAGLKEAGGGERQILMPRQLPAAVASFTGRSAELASLDALLATPPHGSQLTVPIIAIAGTAGVGKTALVVHWAHRTTELFPDGQLYVNLRGYDPGPPIPPADALAGFLQALGVPGPGIPLGLDDRAALYRSMLSGRRIMIVLDNAGEAEQVRALLPGTSSCAAIITSRDSLTGLVARDGARRLDLDVLPHADAVSLLRALIGGRVDAEPEAAAALAVGCCGLPLALRVAAELAASRPGTPLAGLATELADHQRRLDLLDAGGDPRASARAVFSWSLRHLDPDAAAAFRLTGLHPGADFDSYGAAALTGTSHQQASALLAQLASLHLLQPTAPGRYSLHDMLRDYARELAARPGTPDDPPAALSRLIGHYLHASGAAARVLNPAAQQELPACDPPDTPAPAPVDPAAARVWLEAELASLVAVTAHAAEHGSPDQATQLAATLFRYLDSSGHYAEACAIHSHARNAARQTGDQAAEATALTNLGTAEWRQGQYELATNYLQEALALYRQLCDGAGQARALANLGNANLQQCRFDEAVSYYQQALALFRQLGDLAGQAASLGNIAITDAVLGRHQQAADRTEETLSIFRQAGDKAGEAHALDRLGEIAVRQGRYQVADNYLRQARSLCRQAGDRYGEACVLITLAELDLRLGRHEQAKTHDLKALAIRRDIGDRSGEADSLNLLGKVLTATGHSAAARSAHQEALEIATKLRESHSQACAHDGLGDSYRATGDHETAADHWKTALSLYRELSLPEADQVHAKLAIA